MEALGVKTTAELDELFIELVPVVLLRGTEYLVVKFNMLSARRGFGGGGMGPSVPLPITFSELDAFNRLTDAALTPWEIETLTAMDSVYIDEVSALIKSEMGGS